jgi:hypothetical protein
MALARAMWRWKVATLKSSGGGGGHARGGNT